MYRWRTVIPNHGILRTMDKIHAKIEEERHMVEWQSMARLRCENADLNANLFQRCLKDSPTCDCGDGDETTEHYFFKCTNHRIQREKIKNSPNALYFNINTILNGSTQLAGEDKIQFERCIQQFIIDTKRFN